MNESETAEDQAAAQLDASARRMVASWAGDPLVTGLIGSVRPDARGLLDPLNIDTAEVLPAAARMLGLCPTAPDGTEMPNLFAAWPSDRRESAQLVASGIRAGVAEIVSRLRAEGVTSLSPVDHVRPDDDAPDGLGFGFQHLALLLMLWLDVSLAGRSGSEIAEDLPMVGSVGWERARAVLLVGNASQPDILAADTLRRAHIRRSERAEPPEPMDDAWGSYRFGDPEYQLGLAHSEFEPPADPIERHKLPGWSHLAEVSYLVKHPNETQPAPPEPPARHPGRPKGPYLLQTREEIEKPYRELWLAHGRRPSWSQVAKTLSVDERTLRRARRVLGINKLPIELLPE